MIDVESQEIARWIKPDDIKQCITVERENVIIVVHQC